MENFVYDGFCGANLSKYMIEAAKLEGKTLVCLKPCDTYSFNQLIKEHRVDREKTYIIGVGCKGKLDGPFPDGDRYRRISFLCRYLFGRDRGRLDGAEKDR